VIEVYPVKPSDLLEVERAEGKSLLLPFNDATVTGWDLPSRTLTVDPPEGLLDL
jgi:ribosomal 30S subunit maturation factor RimM